MRLKIGVVGAGSMGMNHLRVLRDFNDELVQLVGVAESSAPSLKQAVSRFHVAGYSDYREMIEKAQPHLVAVVVPTHVHFEVAAYALDRGINVLVEKPLTSSIQDALTLIRLAQASGAKLAVGHIERFNPAVIAVKRRLATGELGRIFHLHARRIGPFPPRIRDVGVSLDLASHDIDVMRYLTDAEVEHVYAETQRHVHNTHEDILLGVLRFTNQAIGVLDVNWLTPTKIRELNITGEKGMYLINYLTQDVYFYENDYTPTTWDTLRSFTGVSEGTMTRFKIQKAEPLRLEYEDVMQAILRDIAPTVTGEDGLAVLNVLQQLSASDTAGEPPTSGERNKVQSMMLEVGLAPTREGSAPTQSATPTMQNASSDLEQASYISTVAVIGLGKIGLPLAVHYARQGWRVIGCDSNPEVVETINAGLAHVHEEAELAIEVAGLVQQAALSATTHTSEAVRQAQVVVVIVPVVVDAEHAVNFDSIEAASRAIGAGLQSGTLVIYETTLPVGTTATRLRWILEDASNLQAGRDFYLAYSPERVSSGSIFRDLRRYPKVVGGIDEQSAAAAVAFYRSALGAEILSMASTDEAEFVKLLETTYRDVNIALANEFACFADARKLNVSAAIAAANTQPYSHIHTPGVGVGGHCIPVYPYFLLAGARTVDVPLPARDLPLLALPRLARRINDTMAEYAVSRIEAVVGSLERQAALILGIAYRGDVRETAFTSAQLLQDALIMHGATVYAHDPLYSDAELRSLGYTPLTSEVASNIRAIMLQADHSAYSALDFSRFTNCQALLDGRSALKREAIEALGMRYITIGDGQVVSAMSVEAPFMAPARARGGR